MDIDSGANKNYWTKYRIRQYLHYDIIIAHGGELPVETKEGEYAEFIVTL
jgi:hypothetical protein